jgi:uncharacterized protein YaeQ
MLAIGPKVQFCENDGLLSAKKSVARLPSEEKQSLLARVLRFYCMLKNLVEYDRDTSSVKFKDIFRQPPASLVGAPVTTRYLW